MSKRRLSNPEMAALILYEIGGAYQKIDTPTLTVEAWQRAHDRFAIDGYPQYPDSARVQHALKDAKKVRNGALVAGDMNGGWMMTQAGLDWVKQSERGKAGDRDVDRRSEKSDRFVSRLKATSAFSNWQKGEILLDRFEIAEALELPVDIQRSVLIERLNQLQNSMHLTKNQIEEDYLKWLVQHL